MCTCAAEGQSLSRVSCRQASLRATWLECDDTGHYEPAQCRSDTECFCVNPETGVPLDGSKFTRSELNADLDRCEGMLVMHACLYLLHLSDCKQQYTPIQIEKSNKCTVITCMHAPSFIHRTYNLPKGFLLTSL